MAHDFICRQGIGDCFSGVYYVESCRIKLTSQEKEYSDLILRDKSGSRNVKFWGKTGVEDGSFASVNAYVDNYNDNASVIARSISAVDRPSDLSDYIEEYEIDQYFKTFEYLETMIEDLSKAMGDDTCNVILDEIFDEGSDFFVKFQESVGGNGVHYGKIGGLFANTMRVADYAFKASENYSLDDTERVVLLCSAILHRIGVVDCYSSENLIPETTKKGYLIGVNNMTLARITVALANIRSKGKKLNGDIVTRILHSIAACGKNVQPMTKEAMILSSASMADFKMVEAIEFMNNEQDSGGEFTSYHGSFKKRYFLGG